MTTWPGPWCGSNGQRWGADEDDATQTDLSALLAHQSATAQQVSSQQQQMQHISQQLNGQFTAMLPGTAGLGQMGAAQPYGAPQFSPYGQAPGFAPQAFPLNGRQVFWMSAEVYNPDGTLQPGMSGTATLPLDGAAATLRPTGTDAVSVVEP